MSADNISTTLICKEAGITRTSMYHFFPSKIDVFNLLSERYYAEINHLIMQNLVSEGDKNYKPAWNAVTEIYSDFFNEKPAAATLLLGGKGANQLIMTSSDQEDNLALTISKYFNPQSNTGLQTATELNVDIFASVLKMMRFIFSLKFRKEGHLDNSATHEAEKAAIAYMTLSSET